MIASPAHAELTSVSDDRFTFTLEAESKLPPEMMWERLVNVSAWWGDDHTYSGSAQNMTLNLEPGGLWEERWPGGAVAHGTVLYFKTGETLRLSAPFGPLQDMAVQTVWTITLLPFGKGTKVTFPMWPAVGPAVNLENLRSLSTG
ncbi:MAG: hypothetical protein AAF986_07735 [Pseudomonadota bacterium]